MPTRQERRCQAREAQRAPSVQKRQKATAAKIEKIVAEIRRRAGLPSGAKP
jgi:hypothetical protein